MINKKACILTSAVAACCILFTACSTFKKADKKPDFKNVQEKVWQLDKVQNAAGASTFDRNNLKQEYFNDIYTLQFNNERITGKASPNRYNGPYTLAENNAIAFKNIASTLMMGIEVPQGLSEHQYFQLLQKATNWDYQKDQFIIYSLDDKGSKVTMVFKEFDYR